MQNYEESSAVNAALDAEADWESRYQEGSTRWDRGGPSPSLEAWLAITDLAKGARVVVPGCGFGHEVPALARHGYYPIGLDVAPTPVRHLREQLEREGLEAEVVQADMLAWQPETPVDGVYEQTSLCAIPPEQWPAYEQQLHAWLRPDGELFACFMQTGREGGPPFHCEMADMRALFPDSRWEWRNDAGRTEHTNGKFELLHRLIRR
ncbi:MULTISPECIES: methyltransferase domain-containing protein [unclassified Thioalkalivibrio]|uniref:methyltransferase domain-containing protein n=1 Tax=unclassified Thioalkalivibrio TaxID=2621013 RepID=UPI000364E5AB|nr:MULTISPECIES: methyltransferase domain-containing protein [unclassified Thioalkalivibrio]